MAQSTQTIIWRLTVHAAQGFAIILAAVVIALQEEQPDYVMTCVTKGICNLLAYQVITSAASIVASTACILNL